MTGSDHMSDSGASAAADDTDVVRRAAVATRLGDASGRSAERAARELYECFSPLAWSIARRLCGHEELAREVVQDAMVHLWQQAHTFDSTRGTPAAWVGQVVRSRAIDARRRQRADKRGGDGHDHELSADLASRLAGGDDVEQELLDAESSGEVHAALAELAPEQRVLIELCFLHGYSQGEVSAMLQLPLGTVKARILRGLVRLRRQLEPLHVTQNQQLEEEL